MTPFTNQFNPVEVVPETVALNCRDLPTSTLALAGEILTDTTAGAGVIETTALAEAVD